MLHAASSIPPFPRCPRKPRVLAPIGRWSSVIAMHPSPRPISTSISFPWTFLYGSYFLSPFHDPLLYFGPGHILNAVEVRVHSNRLDHYHLITTCHLGPSLSEET